MFMIVYLALLFVFVFVSSVFLMKTLLQRDKHIIKAFGISFIFSLPLLLDIKVGGIFPTKLIIILTLTVFGSLVCAKKKETILFVTFGVFVYINTVIGYLYLDSSSFYVSKNRTDFLDSKNMQLQTFLDAEYNKYVTLDLAEKPSFIGYLKENKVTLPLVILKAEDAWFTGLTDLKLVVQEPIDIETLKERWAK